MELLDRYLQAVKKHLPTQRQDDIIAELRANLESQLEDKEAALGRPLTPVEAEAWLKELGPPIQMASRYQPPQYLIGPAVFPTYRHVIRLACTWGFIIYSIAKAAETLGAPNPDVGSLLGYLLGIPMLFFNIVAWVTLVFAGFEFAAAQRWVPGTWPTSPGADWAPCTLPPLAPVAAGGKKPRSFMHAVVELAFGFLGLIWLLLLPHYLWLLFGPGAAYLEASPYRISPALATFYWCVVALNAVHLGLKVENLLRGRWQNPPNWQRFLREVFALVPLVPLLSIPGHAFVVLKHPALDQAQLGAGLDAFNHGVYLFLLFVCTITLMQLVWGLGKLGLNAWRKREAEAR